MGFRREDTLASNRHKSKWPGIYYEVLKDGSKSWIATWKEPVFDLANPLVSERRSVERRFVAPEQAQVAKLEGELAAKDVNLTDQIGIRDPVEMYTDTCTVEQWVNAIESTKRRRGASSAKRDDSLLRNHVYPELGSLKLGHVKRRQHVEPWVTGLSATLAPSTVRRAVQLLSGAFEAAIDEGLITRNPCRGVELPREPDREVEYLTVDEIHALAAAIDPRFRAMIYVGGFVGLRIGEAAGLTVPKLDLTDGSLQVDWTLKDGVLKEPKTASSRRTLALSPFVVEELALHLSAYPPGDDDLVFTMPGGGPLHMTNLRHPGWSQIIVDDRVYGLQRKGVIIIFARPPDVECGPIISSGNIEPL